MTKTINNLELRLHTHTSLYLTNKGPRHALQRMVLVTFSNYNEMQIQSSKNRTFKNPIFLGKNENYIWANKETAKKITKHLKLYCKVRVCTKAIHKGN